MIGKLLKGLIMNSKLFKYTGVLDNEAFIEDIKIISKFNSNDFYKIIDLQLMHIDSINTENDFFNYIEGNNIEIDVEKLRSIFSVINLFASFYKEHKKYIKEKQEVINDISNLKFDIDIKHLDKNLTLIYESLEKYFLKDNINFYKNFLTKIYDISYGINLKLIKKEISSFKNNTKEYDNEIITIINDVTFKIQITGKDDVILQLDKNDLDNLLNILKNAKQDLEISNSFIPTDLKKDL